ncbi:hypothetical protein [Streptomyces sp. NPDC058266]|uniref:LexA family protein n=1 Tax=Streptomyces sp. NPDC058266 TaxID=3346412 RepID=UPI0036EC9968
MTERQRSVLAAIRARIADHGEAPTVREIAAAGWDRSTGASGEAWSSSAASRCETWAGG